MKTERKSADRIALECTASIVDVDLNVCSPSVVVARVDALKRDRDRWRSDFQSAEATAQTLDAQWERLSRILGVAEDEDFVEWGQLVDRVAEMAGHIFTLAKLAARTPQFSNPIVAWEAEALRDRILAGTSNA